MTLEESLLFRETLKAAEKTLAGTLKPPRLHFSNPGPDWAPVVREEAATLKLVRATLGQLRRSTARGRVNYEVV
jgi:hypothetical protein